MPFLTLLGVASPSRIAKMLGGLSLTSTRKQRNLQKSLNGSMSQDDYMPISQRYRHVRYLLIASLMAGPLTLAACDKKEPEVRIVREGDRVVDPNSPNADLQTEEAARAERLAERMKEPVLDPKSPRETLQLIWNRGKKRIRSIHHERVAILTSMKAFKIEGAQSHYNAVIDPIITKLESYTIGRKDKRLETAATRLCDLITEVRGPLERVIKEGQAGLEVVDAEIGALDEKEKGGKAVYQKQWDKTDEARKGWSVPISKAKHGLLAIKSMLDEAYVLAEYGPRRAQITLRDCLGKIAAQPLLLEQAQTALTKVIERAKYYR